MNDPLIPRYSIEIGAKTSIAGLDAFPLRGALRFEILMYL